MFVSQLVIYSLFLNLFPIQMLDAKKNDYIKTNKHSRFVSNVAK